MCGFVGYINTPAEHRTRKQNDEIIIKKMGDLINHRGPDDNQTYINNDISLNFRRLSFLDLAHGGQPMSIRDGKKELTITFNGEVYNYQTIKKQLIKLGHHFKTDCDTEVILHGFEQWGVKVINKLRGMFAVAIYDKWHKVNDPREFLFRDYFGIKPLTYYYDGKHFMWASETKAFLASPNFKRELNTKMLPIQFSFDYIPSKETLFKHVYKVMPSQYVEYHIKNNKLESHFYYHFMFHPNKKITLQDAVSEIRKIVAHSIKLHMISDSRIPVGSFLSSGVDSSYILSEASKHRKIPTYSLGYKNSKYSELKYSANFAKEKHQPNKEIYMDADDYFNILPTMAWYNDTPLANLAEPQAYYLCRDSRKDMKATITGEGADEIFGGYANFTTPKAVKIFNKDIPASIRKILGKIASCLPRFHGRRFLERCGLPLYENYYRVNYVFNTKEKNKLFKDSSINKDAGQYTKHIFDAVKNLNIPTQKQYFDIKTWLPFDILHQADRMSMCNSLEIRVPFVDKVLFDYGSKLPLNLRIHNGKGKYVWRKAAEPEVKSVYKHKKLGFPSPVGTWIKQPKFHKKIVTLFHSDIAYKFFNVKYLNKLVKQHDNGKSNTQKIISLYCFILWYALYFPNNTKLNIKKDVRKPVFA